MMNVLHEQVDRKLSISHFISDQQGEQRHRNEGQKNDDLKPP